MSGGPSAGPAASYFHRGGSRPLLGTTIDTHLRGIVASHPEQEAVVSLPQGIRLRYAALDAAVQRLARGLVALGLGRGDRVGIWSTDNAEWVLLQLATARRGGGAWIWLRPGETAEPEALRDYARGKISHFKVPRHVWIVEDFPMTVTGKIQKYRIREIVAGWMAAGGSGKGECSNQMGSSQRIHARSEEP